MAVGVFAIPSIVLADEYRVTVHVDGEEHVRTTRADSVGRLLEDEQVVLGEFDHVTPPLDEKLHDGTEVYVVRGCPVLVDVNGMAEEHGVTCDATVEEMVRELGLDAGLVRTSRSERVRSGETVVLRDLRRVMVEVDGEREQVLTTALTVGELLDDMELDVTSEATVEPPIESRLAGVELVVISRGGADEVVEEEIIAFETIRRTDAYLESGETRVVQEGRDGLRRVVYALQTKDGVASRVEVANEVVREPVDEVIVVGTMETVSSKPMGTANVEQGGATWYQVTSGTCAHRRAPMGTVITVTNNANGATATCTVADRGPFGSGRILDLSTTVFAELAPLSSGVISVTATW